MTSGASRSSGSRSLSAITLLRVPKAETISDSDWRDRAAAVLDDVDAIASLFRTSAASAGERLYVRGMEEAARLADHAVPDVLAGETAWTERVPVREGALRLTTDTTTELPRTDARWVRVLDTYEIPLRTTTFNWRFYNGQCFANVEQALRSAKRPPHITPWVGELVQATGERAEHAWLVSEHADGRSVIDLTLLHPTVIGQLIEQTMKNEGDDRELELLLDHVRRDAPLLDTRVIGRVPTSWMYEGAPMDPDAYIAELG